MEFKGLKIDFIGLAAAITAIASLYMAIKGKQQHKKNKEKKDEE